MHPISPCLSPSVCFYFSAVRSSPAHHVCSTLSGSLVVLTGSVHLRLLLSSSHEAVREIPQPHTVPLPWVPPSSFFKSQVPRRAKDFQTRFCKSYIGGREPSLGIWRSVTPFAKTMQKNALLVVCKCIYFLDQFGQHGRQILRMVSKPKSGKTDGSSQTGCCRPAHLPCCSPRLSSSYPFLNLIHFYLSFKI